MPVSRLQSVQRENPLSNQLIVVIVHGHPEHSEVWEDHLWDRGVLIYSACVFDLEEGVSKAKQEAREM